MACDTAPAATAHASPLPGCQTEDHAGGIATGQTGCNSAKRGDASDRIGQSQEGKGLQARQDPPEGPQEDLEDQQQRCGPQWTGQFGMAKPAAGQGPACQGAKQSPSHPHHQARSGRGHDDPSGQAFVAMAKPCQVARRCHSGAQGQGAAQHAHGGLRIAQRAELVGGKAAGRQGKGQKRSATQRRCRDHGPECTGQETAAVAAGYLWQRWRPHPRPHGRHRYP